MNILHQDGEKKGRFYTEDGLAEIVYSWFQPKGLIIEHTEVDPSLEGKGVGKQLVAALIGWARDNEVRVIPLCPFAKALISRKPEFQDVLFQPEKL